MALAMLAAASAATSAGPAVVYRVSRVIDGDTIALTNGQRVRLVQIDTPEVYSGYECYGQTASATAKRLLPEGTRVRLLLEPASDPVDRYGRLLRLRGARQRRHERQPALGRRGRRSTVVL